MVELTSACGPFVNESKEGSLMIVETDKSTVMRLEHEYDPPRSVRTWLLGHPLSTADAAHQTIPKRVSMAVFSSDALSSTAYATQEILVVLAAAGAAAFCVGVPNLHCNRRAARHCDNLLRADDPRLPGRWRRLHRLARQSGRSAGSNRRRSAAHRLHLDCGSLRVVRRGPDHVRCSGPLPLPR